MINSDQLFELSSFSISDSTLITFFFWAFAIVFSLCYLFFSIIVTRQTSILNRSLKSHSASRIFSISSLLIPLSAALLVFSLVSFGMMFM